MKNIIKTIVAGGFIVGMTALISSCVGEKFHVEGTIGNAQDSVLYFEHNGLTGFTTVDSVKLDEKGAFSFAGDKIDNPEFYRLRIAEQQAIAGRAWYVPGLGRNVGGSNFAGTFQLVFDLTRYKKHK